MDSVAFTGGGTGGHIYPGLAIASLIKKSPPCRMFWIGSGRGMDRAVVESAGMEFFSVPSGKLRRYVSLRNISDVFRIVSGFFAARRILKREKPRLLFSKGGFVSVPPCAAAKSLKIPVFTHESDYSPGLATRINARFAEGIFISYRETAAFFPAALGEKLYVSGNPIRSEFAGADSAKGRAFLGLGGGERILLVLGGSLGSREINELVVECLPELTKYYTVVHQRGEDGGAPNSGKTPLNNAAKERYRPYAYFRDEIPHVIAAAELVLCRGGAGTIWECKSLNKPMVIIPFRGRGTRGDQVENARHFEKAGAAVCFIPEEQGAGVSAAGEKLTRLVDSLANDPARRKAMAEAKIAGFNGSENQSAAFIAEKIIRKMEEVT